MRLDVGSYRSHRAAPRPKGCLPASWKPHRIMFQVPQHRDGEVRLQLPWITGASCCQSKVDEHGAVAKRDVQRPIVPKAKGSKVRKVTKWGKGRKHEFFWWWKRHHNTWKCFWCDIRTSPYKNNRDSPRLSTVDHLLPRSRGGTHAYDNLVLACRECNILKSDRIWIRKDLLDESKTRP